MLSPIPARILRSTATVEVCESVDMYQNQVYRTYTVSRVHLQPSSDIRKDRTNTEQQLRATLYVDAKLSTPHLDWGELLRDAHAAGGDMRVTVRGVVYTVLTVDELREASDQLHHWEVGCV
jgi:hypothetical protein